MTETRTNDGFEFGTARAPTGRELVMKIWTGALALSVFVTWRAPAASQTSEAEREVAHRHYEHGLELARAGEYQKALDEFLAAYERSPHFAVLYNIGQAYIGLEKPAQALSALERYLREADGRLPADRILHTTEQLEALRAGTAELRVSVNVEGATVELDGQPVGTTPLVEPVRVSAGSHLLSVRAAGRPPLLRSVAVAAGQVLELAIELPADMPAPVAELPRVAAAPPLEVPVAAIRPDARDSAAGSPTELRTLAYVLGGSGLALGVASLGHYIWNRERFERWETEDTALDADSVSGDARARRLDNNGLAASIERAEWVTLGLAVAGGACLASGVVLYRIAAPAKTRASVSVLAGPAPGLEVRGQW
jgi:tetratricopeptide (TPR) repeat protein